MKKRIARKTTKKFFTIGYQGHTPKIFAKILKDHQVELLVDVRLLPWSRKAGFSKTRLSKLLLSEGIEYSHQDGLGTPKHVRAHYKKTNDLETTLQKFRTYVRSRRKDLIQLKSALRGKALCFMCMERESSQCHRSIVAEEFQKLTGWEAIHL